MRILAHTVRNKDINFLSSEGGDDRGAIASLLGTVESSTAG